MIDDELRKLMNTEKQDLDNQMESLANLVQLKSLEPVLRKDVCSQLQVESAAYKMKFLYSKMLSK